MKIGKNLLAILAGGITYFLLGWLVYGIILMDFMQNGTNQSLNRPEEEFIWWAMLLSCFAFSSIITLVYHWSKKTSWLDGAKIGVVMGVLITILLDFSFYSMTTIYLSITPIFIEIVASGINAAIVGIVVGLILCETKKK
ncbi:MAG: hypothetical protein Q7J34_12140 [Bacteroidales bacterium]|nr:hypothetical protein [Bacteroidales bacterium]